MRGFVDAGFRSTGRKLHASNLRSENRHSLSVILKDARVAESDEDKPGIILDYDEKGDLVSLEILDASRRVTDARKVEFQTL